MIIKKLIRNSFYDEIKQVEVKEKYPAPGINQDFKRKIKNFFITIIIYILISTTGCIMLSYGNRKDYPSIFDGNIVMHNFKIMKKSSANGLIYLSDYINQFNNGGKL